MTIRPIPDAAVAFIVKHEGRKLTPYRDTAGNWTVGIGHLLAIDPHRNIAASNFKTITPETCDMLLRADMQRTAEIVCAAVKVDLSDNEYAALLSLAFNVPAAMHGSTLLAKLNAGDRKGAAEQFGRWNKERINGVLVESDGLTTRRADERELFLTEVA